MDLSKNQAFIAIKRDFQRGKLLHAYMFLSPDELTNRLLCEYIAGFLLCQTHGPCGVCPRCLKLKKGTEPNLYIFPKNKNIDVEDSLQISSDSSKTPMLEGLKVFILNFFDFATPAAQNKLLKLLEEPPPGTVFLLNAKSRDKVLRTVLSRVKKLEVPAFEPEEILEFLKNKGEKADYRAISLGGGYPGKTLEIASSDKFSEMYEQTLKIITEMKSSKNSIKFSAYLSDKETIRLRLMILLDFFGDMLAAKFSRPLKEARLNDVINEFSESSLSNIISEIQKAAKYLDRNTNPALVADNLLLKILEVKFLWK